MTEPRRIDFSTVPPVSHDAGVSDNEADVAGTRWAQVEYESVLAEFPHLVEVVGGHVAKAGYDYQAEFRFGLDVILDRLEQLRAD